MSVVDEIGNFNSGLRVARTKAPARQPLNKNEQRTEFYQPVICVEQKRVGKLCRLYALEFIARIRVHEHECVCVCVSASVLRALVKVIKIDSLAQRIA